MRALVLLLLVLALFAVVYAAETQSLTEGVEKVEAVVDEKQKVFGTENQETAVEEQGEVAADEEQMSDSSLANGATLKAKTDVNIRAGPCTWYRIEGVLYTGQTVSFTGQVRGGCGYTWYSTNRGWIAAEFLMAVSTGGGLAYGTTLRAKTNVNIRTGPCTWYGIEGVLYTGQTVSYTGQTRSGCGYNWYSTNRGWIAAEFLTSGNVNTGGGGGGGGAPNTMSPAGLNMLKSFEGFRSCKYQDPAGYWTIGYGHLITAGQSFTCISQAEATQLLLGDLSSAENCVRTYVHTSLNGNQFSALVDFTYNLGCGSLASSTLLTEVNARNFGAVCGQLERWVYGGGRVLPGLVRRRQAECQLFNS